MKKSLNKVHRNIPQMQALVVGANITCVLFGRATGKTFGVTAPWLYQRAKTLVRSTGFVCSPTYTHLKDTVVPELSKGWKALGLQEGVHYWLYRQPPIELGIPEPHTPIEDKAKYFIFWLNGSVTKLVSLDHGALVNSKSFDYGAIVEARKCPAKKVYDDLIPTLRGDRDRIIEHYDKTGKVTHTTMFQDYSEHGSMLLESDLPKTKSEDWILNFKKESDARTAAEIIQLMSIRENIPKRNTKQLREIDEALTEMRKNLVFVAKASTLDNIHVLGLRTIKNFRKTLTPRDYDISILGIEQEEVEGNFYSALSRDKHSYSGLNFKRLDKLSWNAKQNWQWHTDLNRKEALYLSFDCNAAHNCFTVFQLVGKRLKLVSYHYMESVQGNPSTHEDVAKQVADYYHGSGIQDIYLIYNHTMIGGARAGLKTKVDEIKSVFGSSNYDYKVFLRYVGQAETHDNLFDLWSKLLRGESNYEFSFNMQTCDIWYECCKDTPYKMIDGRRGQQIKKDKSSERISSGVPPHRATHATEAGDTMIQFLFKNNSSLRDISDMAGA